ncbi:hypothetical protein Agub_g1013 [Astrephomene gubernaculifera]|uniref:Protease Do-like PDZ domain-containing protein n=1 Tax=Astrephomene gubernaculifera TaxID=47775 RepID=A0AAD3DES7_9CHLO|nr:hypothetical protein Agub_g1013 [Astrephomene gubernaculifera]
MSAIVRTLARTGGTGLPASSCCTSAPTTCLAALRTSRIPSLHLPSCHSTPPRAHAVTPAACLPASCLAGSSHRASLVGFPSSPPVLRRYSRCSHARYSRHPPPLLRPAAGSSSSSGQVGQPSPAPASARKPHPGSHPHPHPQPPYPHKAAVMAVPVEEEEEEEEAGDVGLEELEEEAGQKLAPYMDAVVKVYCIHTEPNFSLPWQRKRQYSSSSSGFLVSHAGSTWLLTNAHSVDYHTQVKVKRRGDDRKYLARVLSVGVDCDIAALQVDDPDFWAGMGLQPPGGAGGEGGQQQEERAGMRAVAQEAGRQAANGSRGSSGRGKRGQRQKQQQKQQAGPTGEAAGSAAAPPAGVTPVLELGPLPRLQDGVAVVGYPIGGDTISVTAGVVSRIEVTEYSHGSTELLAIQIDAAINGGNSGGPVFNRACQCVGIAFQALSGSDVENVGYVIPTPVVTHFLDDYLRTGTFSGFPALGISWQRMESEALRRAYGMAAGQKGVLVRAVNPTAASAAVLRPDDVLLSFDGVRISGDGTVPFRTGERIGFSHLVTNKFVGDEAVVEVLRGGERLELRVTLSKPAALVPAHLSNRDPPYLVVGGLVFTPACEPYLQSEYGAEYGSEAPVKLLDRLYHGLPSRPEEEVVVLSQVLACDATLGYEEVFNVQLLAFNGTRVTNLAHLAHLVGAALAEWQQQEGGQAGQGGSDGDGTAAAAAASGSTSGGFLRFDLDYHEVLVLEAEDVLRVTPEVLRSHSIPYDMSPGLKEALQRRQDMEQLQQQEAGRGAVGAVAQPGEGGRA